MLKKFERKLRESINSHLDLRFHFERFFLRGVIYRLIFAIMLIVSIAMFAGVLVWIIAPEFEALGEAVWWAFLRLSDPGYLGDDEGYITRSVSTVVTVLGYVLFLGLLVAILTQWMNQTIERLESGQTPVSLRNHVLILGWTESTPNIVLELLLTSGRASRFLQSHNSSKLRIVILAEDVGREFLVQLREKLGDLWDDRQVIVRQGSPLSIEDLERVCSERAGVIILPGSDFGDEFPGQADAETLKTLRLISQHAGLSDTTSPLAVAGLYNPSRMAIARTAYEGETEVVSPGQFICRLAVQNVIHPGLWQVFSQLLSLNEGSALFIRQSRAEVGSTFGSLRGRYMRAIPIGLITGKGKTPLLNPAPEQCVESGDSLVFIASNFSDCEVKGPSSPLAGQAVGNSGALFRVAEGKQRRVLVLGWSNKGPDLLDALTQQGDAISEILVVGKTPVEERLSELEFRPGLGDMSHVSHIEGNLLIPNMLEQLEPWRFDNIIILARERLGAEPYADAGTISASLTLKYLMEGRAENPQVLLELMEEKNASLFSGGRDDIMVSPMIVSYVLSQVALKRELAGVLQELTRAGGAQIELRSLTDSLQGKTITFEDMINDAASRGEIALGLLTKEGEAALNPDSDQYWVLREGDRMIVLVTDCRS